MRKTLGLTLALSAMAVSAMAVGKVIVDPNISRMPSIADSEASTAADQRLAQKITYTEGYKRLHTVINDLSKASDVHINCGKSLEDWQVQDIPVIVYAKDMPLGKLLRAVADGTHTMFTTSRIGPRNKDEKPTYRICRNTKSVDTIVKQMEDRYYAKFAEAEWGWDALVAFGKDKKLDRSHTGIWAPGFSEVLAFLGDEGKKRVFAGESVIVNTQTAPQIAGALTQLYKNHAPANCTPEDIAKSEVRIALDVVGDSDLQFLVGSWIWNTADGTISHSGYPIPRAANALKNVKGFSLPPQPASHLPRPEEDYPKDRLRILKTEEDWKLPALATKLKLEAPKDKERLTFSDAVIAVAEASGFTIVCEDFQSHKKIDWKARAKEFYVGDTTLGEALKRLDIYQSTWSNDEGNDGKPTWLINEKDKLIIGWANEWREHHYYMVPEKLISDICQKENRDGAQMDDYLPILGLSRGQREQWIYHNDGEIAGADLWMDLTDSSVERSVWRLYAAISDGDRAAVKSAAGLPLSKFDGPWLVSFFSDPRGFEVSYRSSDSEREQAKTKMQLKKDLLTDPKQITSLVMRMLPDPKKHNIELVREINGDKATLDIQGPSGWFPVYSAKRRAELAAQTEK